MRTSNKPAAFELARDLNSDIDHEALDDARLEGYWVRFRIAELPEPLDAIWLQCVLSVPSDAAVRLMQSVAYDAPVNGILDDATMGAVLKMRSVGIEELLLLAQGGYYIGRADHGMCGIDLASGLRRVDRCNQFLVEWTMAHRFAPLHSVK